MDVSVCIVNLNSIKQLEKCLGTLKSGIKPLSYEVIIVDNFSKDGSQNFIRKNFNHVRLITNPRNQGYTSEINKAMKIGKGRYKLILNPDSRLIPRSIVRLVSFLKNRSGVGIVGPLVLNEDGSFQWSCRRGIAKPFAVFSYFLGIARLFPENKIFTGYHLNHLNINDINEVSGVSGSCMVIDQKLIDDIGYFDEKYFAYQEDSDYCLRAINNGWKVYYNPKAVVIHKGGAGGSNSVPFRSIFEWHRSYIIYYFKHFSKDYGTVFNTLYLVVMIGKLIFSEISFLVRR
ncbi:MAG: hypothetical protein CBE24_05210 [bacterium TMED264]|mgnify:CR=1 FL=1|nr:MAG: hypothetical protein CBE24_05210 [bacterium TMED264]